MRWQMETGEIESVLEKIWDLHDKFSDAIHGVTRAHFLHSVKAELSKLGASATATAPPLTASDDGDGKCGFVFVKDCFRAEDDDVAMAMSEARSLNSIRSALENLEDQLEFFHTVQLQQRAERDAAIARLEQSRIILARRLADHQGKKYKVIEEAIEFVGCVHDKGCFVTPETLYEVPGSRSSENLEDGNGKRAAVLLQMLISGMSFAKQSLRLDRFGGVLGNAAMFAVSMLTLLQLHQVAFRKGTPRLQDQTIYKKKHSKNNLQQRNPFGASQAKYLDVLSARG